MTPTSMPAGSDSPEGRPTREERRRRTEASILDAARALFAEVGFERTTIRGVASRAGVDPALVMQYYGSKDGLFAASAQWFADRKGVASATLADLPAVALSDLLAGMEDPELRCAATAVLRSCLTNESARTVMRDQVMKDRHATVAATIGGPDAELRAGLLGAVMIGTTIARYLLEIPAVAQASPEDIERVLQPVLKALVDPSPEA
ncbi:MAG TPA: TetR family transcriptional regulator [Mycobacteriales bacterium]|nr:TetR family transcriptional regulator [Mycobacteriales bacterium]